MYVPSAVQAGVPLKWIIRGTADELIGCNKPLVIPSMGNKKELVSGDNLDEVNLNDVVLTHVVLTAQRGCLVQAAPFFHSARMSVIIPPSSWSMI